jgi:hypothetical protein
MAHRPRQARNDWVRQLLIDFREHTLPKSTPRRGGRRRGGGAMSCSMI